MEICDECGQTITESKWKKNIFEGKILCSGCYDKISEKFYLGE